MKKQYSKPQTHSIKLTGPALMLGGSQTTVNEYYSGDDIQIGDSDE